MSQDLSLLLQDLLKSRRNLLIATADSSLYPDTTGVFQVAGSGELIVARALNFCAGQCLLAKIDDRWVAIAVSDDRQTIRSNVDLIVWRRSKNIKTKREPKFIGTNSSDNPRKLVDDFDNNLTALLATFSPPINLIYYDLNVDNTIGNDESDLDNNYWRVTGFNSQYPTGIFFAIDSNNIKLQYSLNPSNSVLTYYENEYLGNGKYLGFATSDYTTSFAEPFWAQQQTKMRIYDASGIQVSVFIRPTVALEQLAAADLPAVYANPVPANYLAVHALLQLGNYFRYGSRNGSAEFTAINMSIGIYNSQSISGRLLITYYQFAAFNGHSYLPILIGQKTLAMTISDPMLRIKQISDERSIGVSSYSSSGGLSGSTQIYSKVINFAYIPLVKYDLDGLILKINDFGEAASGRERMFYYGARGYTVWPICSSQYFSTFNISANRIEFTQYHRYFVTPQYAIKTITESNIGAAPTSSQELATHPYYLNLQSARVAIVTDRIRNVIFNSTEVTATNSYSYDFPTRLDAANFDVIDDLPNSTSFRSLIWIDITLFDPRFTTIINSSDCYAKIFTTYQPAPLGSTGKIYALEFWVLDDGEIRLHDIHERDQNADAIDSRARIYYPGFEE